jgi:hypothetical protein
MLTLMKLSTGDEWSATMIEVTMIDDCEPDQSYSDLK